MAPSYRLGYGASVMLAVLDDLCVLLSFVFLLAQLFGSAIFEIFKSECYPGVS